MSLSQRPRLESSQGGRPRIVLAVVSVATALWLAAQVFTMVTVRSTTWPFSTLTMFSGPADHATVVSLGGVTRSGERRTLDHEDFGLEAGNSLHIFVHRRIVHIEGRHAAVRPGGRDAARQLVRLYNARHDAEPLTQLRVDVRRTRIPLDSESTETASRLLSVRP